MSILKKFASDVRISTKIAISSVFGIVLVLAIVGMQLYGDGKIQAAKVNADREQTIVADAIYATSASRGMQIAVRDLRLAATPDDIRGATERLEAQRKTADGYASEAITLIKASGRPGENAAKLQAQIEQYAAGAKEVAALRLEYLTLLAKGESSEKIADLQTRAASIVRERTLPAAVEMDVAAAKMIEMARGQVAAENEAFTSTLATVELINESLAGVVIFVLIGTAVFMFFTVIRPIRALTGGMRELAEGNFDVVLPGVGRKDEIGGIAGAVDTFKIKLEEKMRLDAEKEQEIARREQAERDERARKDAENARMVAQVVTALGEGLANLAKGDLTYRVTDEFAAEYKKVQDDFNAAIGQLQETVKNIAMSSSEISNAAAEISTSTTDLSQRTEEQAASLEETSASMEQIAATVKKNAENAQHANKLTQGTQEVADRGGAVVSQAVTAMARIEDSSRKISDIISVIDEIARQTNLLARSRTRICGGGLGSAQPGAAFFAGGQGHQGPDHRQRRPGAGRRRTGQSRGCLARRDCRIDQERRGHRGRYRFRQRRTGLRHRPDQQGAQPDGRGHAAELGPGRGECRHRQDPGRPAIGDERAGRVLPLWRQ